MTFKSQLLIVCGFVYLSQICDSEVSTAVQTEYGLVNGIAAGSVAQFLSIPYAKPPLGDLRWTMPQPPEPWTEPLNCTQQPPPCAAQNGKGQSEDCLYLNVFAPESCTATRKCGVLLWIHGGGYMTGSNHNDGTHLASLNVIVVTIQYRLGALGFLWNPELGLLGNYGHMDQTFAIEWTYRNIEAFGGDKNRIIIFGQSAGATSVALHVMNTSNPFIAGAIAESIPSGVPLRENASWGLMPTQFEDVMGCSKHKYPEAVDRLKCLRNERTIDRVLIAQDEAIGVSTIRYPYLFWPDFMPYGPTVDPNGLIKNQPVFAFMDGDILDIPFIAGTNQNESLTFWDPIPTECFEVSAELEDLFGPIDAHKIREKYHIPKGLGDCREQSKAFQTDSIFRCGSRNITAGASLHKKSPTYWYHFNRVPSFNHGHCGQPNGGVCHTAEVPFVFGTVPDSASKEEQELSQLMMLYWSSFADSGGDVNEFAKKGNNKLFVEWKSYDDREGHKGQGTILFDIDKCEVGAPFEDDVEFCDWWDQEIGYNWLNRL